jgi:hypothetical protein
MRRTCKRRIPSASAPGRQAEWAMEVVAVAERRHRAAAAIDARFYLNRDG